MRDGVKSLILKVSYLHLECMIQRFTGKEWNVNSGMVGGRTQWQCHKKQRNLTTSDFLNEIWSA